MGKFNKSNNWRRSISRYVNGVTKSSEAESSKKILLNFVPDTNPDHLPPSFRYSRVPCFKNTPHKSNFLHPFRRKTNRSKSIHLNQIYIYIYIRSNFQRIPSFVRSFLFSNSPFFQLIDPIARGTRGMFSRSSRLDPLLPPRRRRERERARERETESIGATDRKPRMDLLE